MTANFILLPATEVELTHSKRPFQSIVKTWSAFGFEWLGAKNPLVKTIYETLIAYGVATITDDSGTLTIKLIK